VAGTHLKPQRDRRRAPIPLCVKRENYFFFAAFFLVAFFAAFFFLAAIVLSPGKEGFIPADPPVDRWVMREHKATRISCGPEPRAENRPRKNSKNLSKTFPQSPRR
jgi:hypothetical protein